MCNKFSNRNTEQFISVVRSFRNLTKSLGGCWIADHPDNNKWIEIMWSNRATLVIIHPNRSNRASLTLLSPKQESVHKLLLFNLSIDMTNQCLPAKLFVLWCKCYHLVSLMLISPHSSLSGSSNCRRGDSAILDKLQGSFVKNFVQKVVFPLYLRLLWSKDSMLSFPQDKFAHDVVIQCSDDTGMMYGSHNARCWVLAETISASPVFTLVSLWR